MKNISLEVVRERLLDHVHQVMLEFFYLFTVKCVIYVGQKIYPSLYVFTHTCICSSMNK